MADKTGNNYITGSMDLDEDFASPEDDWNGPGDGYKIWLVLTTDINDSQFSVWNSGAYLFLNNGIGAINITSSS